MSFFSAAGCPACGTGARSLQTKDSAARLHAASRGHRRTLRKSVPARRRPPAIGTPAAADPSSNAQPNLPTIEESCCDTIEAVNNVIRPFDAKFQFEAAPHDPLLFLSAWGQGLWMRNMGDVVGVEERDQPKPGLSLSTPWPNPTTDEVALKVGGGSGWRANADVLDVLGRTVDRLGVDSWRSGGIVSWDGRMSDGSHAPAGVYYIRVSTTAEAVTRALVLVR